MQAIILGALTLLVPGGEAPLSPGEAARRMQLPPGFRAALVASEPEVRQPISIALDDRGRLWVVECYSYPHWSAPTAQGHAGRDRILIFEDADGDGRFEGRKVFWDRGANLSGLEVGFGGAWLCATPRLLFLPDRDGDDRPDGEPEVLLDGWDLEAKHNVFNGLRWGPDGWLYGLNGILGDSRVGPPGAPQASRIRMDCGVWRYHPVRRVFEAVAWGTTNPWGIDWDDDGEAFITNCVIPHLFHVVRGGHYQRMYGQDPRPHLYGLLGSCADHLHWAGGDWQDSRGAKGLHGEAGGGHAHAGAMVYLGDNWPEQYHNAVFLSNLHGSRINQDLLEPSGSSCLARHGKDFLLANDEWFRALELEYGPDGTVFITDWSDSGECHDYDLAHRESGRIWRISHGEPRPARVDLARLADRELVELQLHRNDWHVRHARRLLQERAAAGKDLGEAHRALEEILLAHPDIRRRLRALWALHASGGLPEARLLSLLSAEDDRLRLWAVRLLSDTGPPSPSARRALEELAAREPSPRARLSLASMLQSLPPEERWGIGGALAARAEDASDPMLPLMVWYGLEPAAASDPRRAGALLSRSALPALRRSLARRAVEASPPGKEEEPLGALAAALTGMEEGWRIDVLAGAWEGLQGRRGLQAPRGWLELLGRFRRQGPAELRRLAGRLAMTSGDREARVELEAALADRAASREAREAALDDLVAARAEGLAPLLRALLAEEGFRRGPVLRALASGDDPRSARAIVEVYPSLGPIERTEALATLASRGAFARVLLEGVESGTVPRRDLTTLVVRQVEALGDPALAERLRQAWGAFRPPSAEKRALLSRYRADLTPERLREADLQRGRREFDRLCLSCHRLFGTGGEVGPDLTGSQRSNLDYLLENLLDPSAVVGRDDQLHLVVDREGRLYAGLIRERTERSLTVQTATERVVLPVEEVQEARSTGASMMPEGLLSGLGPEELRDLIAYLGSPRQVER